MISGIDPRVNPPFASAATFPKNSFTNRSRRTLGFALR